MSICPSVCLQSMCLSSEIILLVSVWGKARGCPRARCQLGTCNTRRGSEVSYPKNHNFFFYWHASESSSLSNFKGLSPSQIMRYADRNQPGISLRIPLSGGCRARQTASS